MTVPTDSLASFESWCRKHKGSGEFLDGRKIALNHRRDLVSELIRTGCYEAERSYWMWKRIQPGWYCLDVGANVGWYSTLMCSKVGSTGRVLAFEPNPKLVKLLERTKTLNSFEQLTICDKPAWNRSNEAISLAIPSVNTGGGTWLPTWRRYGSSFLEACSTTIDEQVADWPRLDLIKIDIEGAEWRAWRGMKQTRQRFPDLLVLMEVHYALEEIEPLQECFIKENNHLFSLIGESVEPVAPEDFIKKKLSTLIIAGENHGDLHRLPTAP